MENADLEYDRLAAELMENPTIQPSKVKSNVNNQQ